MKSILLSNSTTAMIVQQAYTEYEFMLIYMQSRVKQWPDIWRRQDTDVIIFKVSLSNIGEVVVSTITWQLRRNI